MAADDFDWDDDRVRFARMTVERRALSIRWKDIREIEAVEPWPCFQIVWTDRQHGPDWRAFTPYLDDLAHFEARVEALFATAMQQAPAAVKRGWLDLPRATWEPAADMPSGEEDAGGAYRGRASEKVLARRRPPHSLEALMQRLLVGRPPRDYASQPQEVAVTPTMVYKRAADGRCWKIRRETLRFRRTNTWNDAVYVFGRATTLVLLHRDACPVTTLLDQQLAGKPDEMVP